MIQHLLYIVAQENIDDALASMSRLGAQPSPTLSTHAHGFTLSHPRLRHLRLEITLLHSLNDLGEHLRQYPVDLLVYDERFGGIDAVHAVERICREVRIFADQWGPDFYFPSSRIVVILKEDHNIRNREFQLGRLEVRDILVEPKNTAHLLKWIFEVLYAGIIRENRVGIAMSGGGLDGLLYQLGVLHALNQALADRSIYDLDVVTGVSSGGLAGMILAAQIEIVEVIRSFHDCSKVLPSLKIQTMMDVALGDISKRMIRESIGWKLSPSQWLSNFTKMIPTGIFKGDKLEAYLVSCLESVGQPDRFDKLKTKFYVGATDQDSFEHVIFGEKGRNKMKVSEACRASCAFPMYFAPKTILGRNYVDGQVTRSCNLELAVKEGARLLFVVDPLKPAAHRKAGAMEDQGGYFGIVQVIKALCSTRFEASFQSVSARYPDCDFIVFQPGEECASLMTGSPMSFKIKTQLMKLAYMETLRKLRERHNVYQTKMSRYGFQLSTPQRLEELENDYDRIFATTN